MDQLVKLYHKCSQSDSNFFLVLLRFCYYRILYGVILIVHPRVTIKGIRNIQANGKVEIGIGFVGFMHTKDRTYLNIRGKLIIAGSYNIGRGCRFDIGEDAIVKIGRGGYINCNSRVVISHYLEIGDNCVISWDCQFLDEDFHDINYPGKRKKNDRSIVIGNNVWVGSGVKIYKGTVIPDGCVIASDSVVKGYYDMPKSLICGIPARIIKENVEWK